MTCPNTGWGKNPKMIIEQTRLFGTQEYFAFIVVKGNKEEERSEVLLGPDNDIEI